MPRFLSRSGSQAILILTVLFHTTLAQAQVTFIATRSEFNLAAPGLPIEDFEEAHIPGHSVNFISAPLDSTTDNGTFAPGEILPGLSITSSGNKLVVIDGGIFRVPSKSVFCDPAGATMVASFGEGVNAVGLDLYAFSEDGDRTIHLFSSSEEIASTTLFTLTSGTFLGFTSTVPITSLLVDSVIVEGPDGRTGFDNIAFPSATVVDVAPEPGTLALLSVGLGIVGLGTRRYTNNPFRKIRVLFGK